MRDVRPRGNIAKTIALSVVSLAFCLGILEAAAWIWLKVTPWTPHVDTLGGLKVQYKLHPYLGFVASCAPNVNTFGIPNIPSAALDLPYAKTEANEVVVALFGGSVAAGVYSGNACGTPLEQILAARPELAGRKITVLNFAFPAYKQPQQLLALTYLASLGQRLDLVLEIDGANEAMLPYTNTQFNLPPSYPSTQIFTPLLTQLDPGKAQKFQAVYAELERDTATSRSLSERIASAPTALWRAVLIAYDRIVQERIARVSRDLIKGDASVLGPPLPVCGSRFYIGRGDVTPLDVEGGARTSANLWRQGSLLMHALAGSMGGRFLHVLQPHQHAGQHRFSEEEKAIAILTNDPVYGEIHKLAYEKFTKAIPELRSEGVNVISGVGLFDAVNEPVYSDTCCHYNALGERLFSGFVASASASALSSQ